MQVSTYTAEHCKVCKLQFLPVKWLSHRALGYCSSECMESTFEWWFSQCMLAAVDANLGPPDYVFDLKNCPTWRAMWKAGMTSEAAMHAHFDAPTELH